jgi:hypothetical protein
MVRKSLAKIGLTIIIASFFLGIVWIINEGISNSGNSDPTNQYNQSQSIKIDIAENASIIDRAEIGSRFNVYTDDNPIIEFSTAKDMYASVSENAVSEILKLRRIV